MPYYRLELCPTDAGRKYYTSVPEIPNENAGFDLFVVAQYDVSLLAKNETPVLLDLGTAARLVYVYDDGLEEDVHYWLCPRSSIFKTGMVMANSQGVIDRTYRGILKAPVWVAAKEPFHTAFSGKGLEGMRLFQVVAPDMGWIKEVRVVDYLPETTRGEGGFGSTGR
jgi:dUTPase